MDTADSSTIHFKSAAGELMCTFAYDSPCTITAQKEYRPFVLCTKGVHAGEMISAQFRFSVAAPLPCSLTGPRTADFSALPFRQPPSN